jgi:hypothetical protein
MAIIKQGILGGLSGKIGSVVGSSWKGRAILKSLPLSVANPRTAGQVSQRTAFALISILSSVILTFIVRPVYNPISGNVTGSNLFTSQNKAFYTGAGVFDSANAFIGGGTLPADKASSGTWSVPTQSIDIGWINSAAPGNVRETDLVYAFVLEPVSGAIYSTSGTVARLAQAAECHLISGEKPDAGQKECWVFLAFVSADGRTVSVKVSPVAFDVTFV